MLEHCFNHLNQYRNNFATQCCAKNRCCESPRVTPPLNALTTSARTCYPYLFAQSRSSRISASPGNIPNNAMRQAMNQTRGKFQKTSRNPPPGGGGRTQQIFIRGGSAPRSNPLPFALPLFHEKGTPFVYLLLTNGTPFIYLV